MVIVVVYARHISNDLADRESDPDSVIRKNFARRTKQRSPRSLEVEWLEATAKEA